VPNFAVSANRVPPHFFEIASVSFVFAFAMASVLRIGATRHLALQQARRALLGGFADGLEVSTDPLAEREIAVEHVLLVTGGNAESGIIR